MNRIHSNRSALVVGAGVAGLTATTLLRRSGWDVTLVERAPALRTGGYKVDVRGAGIAVLRNLGLAEAARARACHVRAGSIVAPDGRVIAAMGGDTFGGRVSDDIELERGDLVRLLADAAGDVVFGVEPTALRPVDDGVEVTLSSGDVALFDVVLGADGLHSGVRRLAVAPDVAPDDLGHAIAVATLPTGLGLGAEETTCVAAGRTALLYATETQPRARAMFLFQHEGPLPSGRDERGALLRDRFAGLGWRVPEVLDALDDADDLYLDHVAQVRLDRWSSGRVGLLGDAAACASPASGQGTTLALVMAHTVVAALGATPQDVAGALQRAEASLRPFAERNQALGPANLKRMVLPSERSVRTTLAMLRIVNALPFTDALLGFVARALARASAFELPEVRAVTAGRGDREVADHPGVR